MQCLCNFFVQLLLEILCATSSSPPAFSSSFSPSSSSFSSPSPFSSSSPSSSPFYSILPFLRFFISWFFFFFSLFFISSFFTFWSFSVVSSPLHFPLSLHLLLLLLFIQFFIFYISSFPVSSSPCSSSPPSSRSDYSPFLLFLFLFSFFSFFFIFSFFSLSLSLLLTFLLWLLCSIGLRTFRSSCSDFSAASLRYSCISSGQHIFSVQRKCGLYQVPCSSFSYMFQIVPRASEAKTSTRSMTSTFWAPWQPQLWNKHSLYWTQGCDVYISELTFDSFCLKAVSCCKMLQDVLQDVLQNVARCCKSCMSQVPLWISRRPGMCIA